MPGASRGVRRVSSGSFVRRVFAWVARVGLLGGSSVEFRRRFPPWEFNSPRSLRSLRRGIRCRGGGGPGASGSSGGARVKPRVSGAQGFVSRLSRDLDLRSAEERFREEKVEGVAAFR
jgi:hypothetical protein